jgi:hypothetical protein
MTWAARGRRAVEGESASRRYRRPGLDLRPNRPRYRIGEPRRLLGRPRLDRAALGHHPAGRVDARPGERTPVADRRRPRRERVAGGRVVEVVARAGAAADDVAVRALVEGVQPVGVDQSVVHAGQQVRRRQRGERRAAAFEVVVLDPGEADGEVRGRAGSGYSVSRICSSRSWRGSTTPGAPVIRSVPLAVLGKAMQSRILLRPV